jgi:hypothetical protein
MRTVRVSLCALHSEVFVTRSICFFPTAVDMRKALKRDVKKESVVPLTKPITPDELEW